MKNIIIHKSTKAAKANKSNKKGFYKKNGKSNDVAKTVAAEVATNVVADAVVDSKEEKVMTNTNSAVANNVAANEASVVLGFSAEKLNGMTVAMLKEQAKYVGLTGYSRMKKDALVAALAPYCKEELGVTIVEEKKEVVAEPIATVPVAPVAPVAEPVAIPVAADMTVSVEPVKAEATVNVTQKVEVKEEKVMANKDLVAMYVEKYWSKETVAKFFHGIPEKKIKGLIDHANAQYEKKDENGRNYNSMYVSEFMLKAVITNVLTGRKLKVYDKQTKGYVDGKFSSTELAIIDAIMAKFVARYMRKSNNGYLYNSEIFCWMFKQNGIVFTWRRTYQDITTGEDKVFYQNYIVRNGVMYYTIDHIVENKIVKRVNKNRKLEADDYKKIDDTMYFHKLLQ